MLIRATIVRFEACKKKAVELHRTIHTVQVHTCTILKKRIDMQYALRHQSQHNMSQIAIRIYQGLISCHQEVINDINHVDCRILTPKCMKSSKNN